MYDKHIDENNPMFDLNRDLIKEQSDITIITQENVYETVSKILDKQPTVKRTASFIQGNLFD
jgi:DNA processing protein